jgi:hypothetical protein
VTAETSLLLLLLLMVTLSCNGGRVVLGLSNVCVVVGHKRHVGYKVLVDSLWSSGDDEGVDGADTAESTLSRQGQCWVTRLVNSAHCS